LQYSVIDWEKYPIALLWSLEIAFIFLKFGFMSLQTKPIYEFGPFRLDPTERVLLREERPVSLTPKMFDILLFLVERNGQVVEKDELMCAIWPDTFVEEANLAVNISSLRKALSEAPGGRHYIETVQRRGYRFEAPLKRIGENQTDSAVDAEESTGSRSSSIRREVENSVVATSVIGKMWRSSRVRLLALAIAIVVGGSLAFGIYRINRSLHSIAPFQTMKLTRMTTSGKAQEAVISPDGKYVLYTIDDAGKRSLWVRQVAGDRNIQIIPPTEARFCCLTTSRDGDFIYFRKLEPDKPVPALYRMPALGGEAKRLITDIGSPVTVSPDGKRLAFLRHSPSTGETSLVVTDADGSDAQTLANRRLPDRFFRRPAWSPDGKIIACQSQMKGGLDYGIVAISIEGGAERIITTARWGEGELAWLADGSGLVMSATKRDPGLISINEQLWLISYPSGETRRITNDLNRYGGVSLTADSNTLVTLQGDSQSNIWLVPQGQSEFARQITFGSGRYDGRGALEWTPDGLIVYSTVVNGKGRLWLMDSDGTNARPLTPDTNDRGNWEAAVSPDGSFIVYVSVSDYPHLWRMSLSGGDPRQLTFGNGEGNPQISPNGGWVVYTERIAGKPVLMKMPAAGGAPIQITDKYSNEPAISHDGKLIAYQHWDERPDSPPRTQIIPFSGGAPIKSFVSDWQPNLRWSPDGKGLIYIQTRAGISNLWKQPLDGGAPVQLTDFKSDRIYNYAWSRDGKQLVCVRGSNVSDVVLINGFR
jgi:Tol biopolymer transport system component/DNA-binding winged helix-turn-helix (wHTH) protein